MLGAMSGRVSEHKRPPTLRAVALLKREAAELRAEVATLRRERLPLQQQDADCGRSAQIVEANERLVIAALEAEHVAETAVNKLDALARASERDALTGTPNRALMLDRLENALALARRRRGRVAVLFLDLDGFKGINDSLGHAAGDEVLQLVSRRLESVIRESDTISRHGGDEFLVLLAAVSQPPDAALIAEKILAAVAEPTQVGGRVLRLSASIGIAIYPDDGEDVASLISAADAAMFRSKRDRRGGLEFHRRKSSGKQGTASSTSEAGQPVKRYGSALAEQDPFFRDLREANEQLVISALVAQELEEKTEAAHREQVDFLAIVAHELRNPLGPIRNAAELLAHGNVDDSLLARLPPIIKRQVAHMTRLVDDLLDGSRVSAGKFRLERTQVDLAMKLSLAIETCRPAFDKKRQRLTVQVPPDLPRLNGDPVRLAQIFGNLLDNASKYTPEGGEISVSAVALEGKIEVTVSDNGIGLSPESLPHIFELFVQESRAVARHGGGLGIGLAVVRDLVEAHGGTVVASSAGTDQGSRFLVTLPSEPEKISRE